MPYGTTFFKGCFAPLLFSEAYEKWIRRGAENLGSLLSTQVYAS